MVERTRRELHGVATALSLVFVSASTIPNIAQSENTRPPGAADETIAIQELNIPPSEYWSPEFRKAYLRHINQLSDWHTPKMDAPKAEWDKFDAAIDRSLASEALAWYENHYPVNVVDTEISGVHVGVITPSDGISKHNQDRVLINLHGGGFFIGRGLRMGQLEAIPIASIGKIKVVTVDYRQAPYDRYPAASEDVETVYRKLLKRYKPEAVGIFGCSAGGVLAAQALARFQAKGLFRPGAVGIFCASPPAVPFVTIKHGDSAMWGLRGLPVDRSKRVVTPADWYMEPADIHDPQAYPGSSDSVLAKFPPTLLVSGTRSSDMSPVIVAHAKLLKLGVDSSLYLLEGGWHGAHIGAFDSPEAHDAQTYIASWFDQHLAR